MILYVKTVGTYFKNTPRIFLHYKNKYILHLSPNDLGVRDYSFVLYNIHHFAFQDVISEIILETSFSSAFQLTIMKFNRNYPHKTFPQLVAIN